MQQNSLNRKMPKYKLLPLRIPCGWKVIINNLSDLEPNSLKNEDRLWMTFTQDMLNIKHCKKDILVDVGWYPENDPNGEYKISVIKNNEWEIPTEVHKCKKNDELVEFIDKCLWNYT